MKKLCFAVVGLVLLALCVIGVVVYAEQNPVVLQTPTITALKYDEGVATFTWSPVQYSTSYRIYTRADDSDGWKLYKAVGNKECSYKMSYSNEETLQVSVRACNVSRGKSNLSSYSPATIIQFTKVEE